MIEVVVIIALVISMLFGFVLLFGAPYLPILRPQLVAALELIDLKPGDHLLELGCGDGRVLIAAAEQGLRVTGYELNPLLALIAWLTDQALRQASKSYLWQLLARAIARSAGDIRIFVTKIYDKAG